MRRRRRHWWCWYQQHHQHKTPATEEQSKAKPCQPNPTQRIAYALRMQNTIHNIHRTHSTSTKWEYIRFYLFLVRFFFAFRLNCFSISSVCVVVMAKNMFELRTIRIRFFHAGTKERRSKYFFPTKFTQYGCKFSLLLSLTHTPIFYGAILDIYLIIMYEVMLTDILRQSEIAYKKKLKVMCDTNRFEIRRRQVSSFF